MEYDPASALIVVDVQNDFADPNGSLEVPGGEDAIVFINDEIASAVAAKAVVAYTQDWHPSSTPHFEKDGGIWPVHCVADSWGASLHPDLHVVDGALIIKKGIGGEDGYSGFTVRNPVTGVETPTGLEDQLRGAGVTKVYVVGLALDYCVKETAIDAATAGFVTRLLADGTRPVNLRPGDGTRAVAAMVDANVSIE